MMDKRPSMKLALTEQQWEHLLSIIDDQVTRDRNGYPADWAGWSTSEVGKRIAYGVMERLEE